MTVYARHSRGFKEGVEVFAYDELPDGLRQVWEVAEGFCWERDEFFDVWTHVGDLDSVELNTRGLLDEVGPVTDDRGEVHA